jgi:class 3 adenylate cyclase
MRTSTVGREIIKRVLELLREWGWDTGIEKLRAELDLTENEEERVVLQFFVGWMAGERGFHAEALKQMRAVKQLPQLKAWSLVGQAFVMLRQSAFKTVHKLLDEALKVGQAKDPVLQALIAHCRGATYYHQGRNKQALLELHAALKGYGRDHFRTGRVLDTIGMVYSSKNQYHAALELYLLALKYKERHGDDAGQALTHGQLGRLFFDWERYEQADAHFHNGLNLSRIIGDKRGEALGLNHLARISIAMKDWGKAVDQLQETLRLSKGRDWKVIEGFARKDLARAFLGQGNLRASGREIKKSRDLFEAADFVEGLAHVRRVEGVLFRTQKKFVSSLERFREAWLYFKEFGEPREAARTEFEAARTQVARGSTLAVEELKTALNSAEECQFDGLVAEIQSDLRAVDELEYYKRIYERARGRGVTAGTESLFAGKSEPLSVLFLDVQGSTEYAKDLDAEAVMMTMNVMNAHFVKVLRRYGVSVSAYRGDGFMALVTGLDHPRRAVQAALEMIEALAEFNWPPSLIREYEDEGAASEMKPLSVRIGIATGEAFVGNVGTYDKMDYTALGTTCNLGARLEAEAEPLIPCISQATYERVRNQFLFSGPRDVKLKGLEDLNIQAWDVVGSKQMRFARHPAKSGKRLGSAASRRATRPR